MMRGVMTRTHALCFALALGLAGCANRDRFELAQQLMARDVPVYDETSTWRPPPARREEVDVLVVSYGGSARIGGGWTDPFVALRGAQVARLAWLQEPMSDVATVRAAVLVRQERERLGLEVEETGTAEAR